MLLEKRASQRERRRLPDYDRLGICWPGLSWLVARLRIRIAFLEDSLGRCFGSESEEHRQAADRCYYPEATRESSHWASVGAENLPPSV